MRGGRLAAEQILAARNPRQGANERGPSGNLPAGGSENFSCPIFVETSVTGYYALSVVTPLPPSDPATDAPQYEEFVRLLVAHEPRLRAFLRALLPGPDEVDDVMQETSLVAWRKFCQFRAGSNFMAWIAAIARFEALAHLRRRGRQPLAFSPEVLDLIASEGIDESDRLERERSALERCLGKLGESQRELLLLSYRPGARFREVAGQAGRSVQGYYKALQRLRSRLLDCIREQLREEPA